MHRSRSGWVGGNEGGLNEGRDKGILGGVQRQAREGGFVKNNVSGGHSLLGDRVVTPPALVAFSKPKKDALLGVRLELIPFVLANMDKGATAKYSQSTQIWLPAMEHLIGGLAFQSRSGGGVHDPGMECHSLTPQGS